MLLLALYMCVENRVCITVCVCVCVCVPVECAAVTVCSWVLQHLVRFQGQSFNDVCHSSFVVIVTSYCTINSL